MGVDLHLFLLDFHFLHTADFCKQEKGRNLNVEVGYTVGHIFHLKNNNSN